jgi:hypothetical protein
MRYRVTFEVNAHVYDAGTCLTTQDSEGYYHDSWESDTLSYLQEELMELGALATVRNVQFFQREEQPWVRIGV